jgi:type II secretory pathway component PulC
MRHLVLLTVALASLPLAACGSAEVAAIPAAAPVSPRVAPPGAAAVAGDRKLMRSTVHEAVAMGLGAFLQNVTIDDQPVRVAGKFHGFRIAALSSAPFWSTIDVKPGDVVTGINGLPIERPEQAQTAFESLEVASELHISLERDGQPHDLILAIVDDR